MKLRSLLYVPADNDVFIRKAHERGADAIILDLEDAVKKENKVTARDNLQQSVKLCRQSGAVVFVRINGDKSSALKDAKAAFNAGASGLYVPKARVKRLRLLDDFLNQLENETRRKTTSLVALIEDAKGVLQAERISRQKRVIALTIGAEDFANSIGAQADPDVLMLPKQIVHLAAKSQQLMSFGLFRSVTDYADIQAITAAATEARRFGFDGASCVHPNAVSILNAAFSPSEQDILWATKVLAKATEHDAGAFEFDGKMVDVPILEKAREILCKNAAKT